MKLFLRRIGMRTARASSFLLISLLLAGCAQITAVPVTPNNPYPDGLPFYGHKPILVVSSQGAKIEVIPNLNERYALQVHSFLAKNHSKLNLGPNGTVTSIDANLDAASIISFFEKALDKIPTSDSSSAPLSNAQGDIAVYEFVFQPDGQLSLRKLLLSKMEYKPRTVQTTPSTGNKSPSDAGSVAPIPEEQ